MDVRAYHQSDRPVSVDVIGAILGIILNNKDRGLRPVSAVRDALDDLTHSKIVACHHGYRRESAGCGTPRVIFWQAHHHKVR